MKRAVLLSLLERYKPEESEEKNSKSRMIQFIRDHKDCFDRQLEIGHITGSSFLINKAGTHALLMHHVKLDKWLQLGGHCDGVSDVLAVALKEAREESGVGNIKPVMLGIFDIDIHTIPEHKGIKEHEHFDVRFLLRVTSDEQVVKNTESNELRWIAKDTPLNQLPTTEPSVMRMFKKWQNRH